jgi:hypothetical protein
MATTIANASSPVTMASRHRGRQVSAVDLVASGPATDVGPVGVVDSGTPAGGAAAEPSSACGGRAEPEGESGCAVGSAAGPADAAVSVG